MQNKCMMCGETLQDVECTGTMKGMKISFCDEHAGFCENCETVTCKITK